MTDMIQNVNTIAPLANVSNFMELMETVMNSPAHLPSMAVFYGYSGYGKTFSATYAAHSYRAMFLEIGRSWSATKFLEALCEELGVKTRGTKSGKMDRIIEALLDTPDRPLIIDEFDYFVEKPECVELVREIINNANTPIILVGEEMLPQNLKQPQYERFHNRILAWQPALKSTYEDAVALANLYAKDVEIDPALLKKAYDASSGVARRICVNLHMIKEEANNIGGAITIADWGGKSFYEGNPPARRGFK